MAYATFKWLHAVRAELQPHKQLLRRPVGEMKQADVLQLQRMLNAVHQQFINAVPVTSKEMNRFINVLSSRIKKLQVCASPHITRYKIISAVLQYECARRKR